MLKPAVFIDRDGTISEEAGYINHASRIKLIPGAAEAVKKLNAADIPAVLVTNQAGVARGYFPEERVLQVHERLEELLAAEGARLDGIYYCPHHRSSSDERYAIKCDCRKPAPGMVMRAAEDLDLDVAKSYVIGDKFSDVELADRVGCKGIFVLTGYGLGLWEYDRDQMKVEPHYVAKDLADAVDWLMSDMKKSS